MGISPFASLGFYLINFSYLLLPVIYTYNNNNTKSTLTISKYTVLLSVVLSPYNEYIRSCRACSEISGFHREFPEVNFFKKKEKYNNIF